MSLFANRQSMFCLTESHQRKFTFFHFISFVAVNHTDDWVLRGLATSLLLSIVMYNHQPLLYTLMEFICPYAFRSH
jgi:hypothetical protein